MKSFLKLVAKLIVWLGLGFISVGFANFIITHWVVIVHITLSVVIYITLALVITRFKALQKAYRVFTTKIGD